MVLTPVLIYASLCFASNYADQMSGDEKVWSVPLDGCGSSHCYCHDDAAWRMTIASQLSWNHQYQVELRT